MGYHTLHLFHFAYPYVACVARWFKSRSMGQRTDQLRVHIWYAKSLIYLARTNLPKNSMSDLDLTIESTLRFDAVAFGDVY